ncbi:glycosyltransferase [Empedobacter tilapiae]|uniref:glycosyltransferase family 2 protein n=1 Tax=Empedobacter tilapiae TaxID=2491114 RepID=UPI0028D2D88B|nr:glycosyltransferase [Empedobacter tilapiae]
MNILIKSYYRPYLLDRCLKSIYEKVNDANDLEIIVLDDGTPQKYLDKIKEKYPNVEFKFSSYRNEKIEKLNRHLQGIEQYHDTRIPTDLWYNAIAESSEILIITEDDVWFVDDFNMKFYTNEMQKYGIQILKMGRDITETANYSLTDTIAYHNPKYIIKSHKLYNVLLNNSFDIRNKLTKLNLLPKHWRNELWKMYDIPMAMMRKDYLLYIWKDKYKRVVEDLQLANAVGWDIKTKGTTKYTLLKNRVMETSYCSSASFNAFNIEENFDLIKFNYILNELWYNDEFNSYENHPNDFSIEYIYDILKKNDSSSFADKWKKWTEGFKEMHKES